MITTLSRKTEKAIGYRKHGAKAREQNQERLRTTLTFERGQQAYLWLTDRSRSRN